MPTGKRGFQTEYERRRRKPDAGRLVYRETAEGIFSNQSQRSSRRISPRDLWMIRQELGLSRDGMASIMNLISSDVVTRWETGERPPTPRQLRILIKHVRRHAHRSAYLREIARRFKPNYDSFSAT